MGGLRAVRKRHVWLLAPFVALVAPLNRTLGDNSFLWHVRAGTVQLDAGEVLRSDPFSYTAAGEAWRTQSWLAELGYALLENTFGGVGWSRLVVFGALLGAGLLVMRRAEHRGAPLPIVFGLGLAFVLQTFVFAVPRPVVFSYPLLALVASMADDDEAELWLAPAVIWLWASLHGSFALGLGVLGLDALRRRDTRRWITLGLATLAASATAHGLAVWQILIDFAGSRETLQLIEEWGAPSIGDVRVAPFYAAFALLVLLGLMRRISWRDLVLAVPFALFGLLAARNTLPSLIVVGPIVASQIGRLGPSTRKMTETRELPLANTVLAGLVVLLPLVVAVQPQSFRPERFPGAPIVRALEEGRVFHDDAVGGYLIWSVGPEREVYIDDRAELHGVERFEEMAAAMRGEGSLRILDTLEAMQALVPIHQPLVGVLRNAGWLVTAEDEFFVLLVRPV